MSSILSSVEAHKIFLRDNPIAWDVIRAAFPDYRKRACYLLEFPQDSGVRINSYWDGGTREYFAVVRLSDMKQTRMPTQTHPFFDMAPLQGQETTTVSVDRAGNVMLKYLPPGFALVSTGMFCGKPSTARVWLNAENITKMLPAIAA